MLFIQLKIVYNSILSTHQSTINLIYLFLSPVRTVNPPIPLDLPSTAVHPPRQTRRIKYKYNQSAYKCPSCIIMSLSAVYFCRHFDPLIMASSSSCSSVPSHSQSVTQSVTHSFIHASQTSIYSSSTVTVHWNTQTKYCRIGTTTTTSTNLSFLVRKAWMKSQNCLGAMKLFEEVYYFQQILLLLLLFYYKTDLLPNPKNSN